MVADLGNVSRATHRCVTTTANQSMEIRNVNEERTRRDDDEAEVETKPGIWDILVAEDDTEVDLEELAAFTEGRLPPAQHEDMRRLAARSPRAMELVDSLQDFMEAEAAETTTTSPPVSRARKSARPSTEYRRTLALAASALLAALAGYLAIDYYREARRSPALQLARNELATQINQFSSGLTMKGGTRQPEQTIDELLQRAAELGATTAVPSDPIAMLLADGNYAEALRECEEARKRGDPTPELLNLHAAATFQNASELRGPARDEAFAKAEHLLRLAELAAPKYAPTYFNQVLLYRALGNRDKDKAEAWNKYRRHEKRPEYREAAQLLLGQP